MNPKEALELAIRIANGQAALARACDQDGRVKQAHIWNWLNRDDGRVRAENVIGVCQAVGFRVRPHDLRPDLYPHPDDGLPERAERGNVA
ncbi:YdaS family helix-turn-helix protein [Alloalcanivorax xenomutans]